MIFFKSFDLILCLSLNCVNTNILFLYVLISPSNHEQHATQIRKPFELTCGAKVFGQISNCLRPSCLLLNRSNFFLLERAKLELQLLYQTYFSRTILRRRKSKKTNTSKKVLATSLSSNIIFYLLLVFFHQKINEKTR